MITAIEIENFKAFGERQRVELRPITLLYGPNSGGKSSVLHALHFARELFLRGKVDVHRTESGGDYVDLGGLQQMIHRNSWAERLSLKFEVTLRGEDLPEFPADRGLREILAIDLDAITSRLNHAAVEISIGEYAHNPHIVSYAVEINGSPLGRLWLLNYDQHIKMTDINWGHPVFLTSEEQAIADKTEELEVLRDAAEAGGKPEDPGLLKLIEEGRQDSRGALIELFELAGESPSRGTSLQLARSHGQFDRGAMPAWDRPLEIHFPSALAPPQPASTKELLKDTTREQQRRANIAEQLAARAALTELISKLVVGVGQHVRDELEAFRYVGPLRAIPPRRLSPSDPVGPSRWPSGIAAWELLRDQEKLRKEVSQWMWSDQRLNTGYQVERVDYKEISLNLARRMLNSIPVDDEVLHGSDYEEVDLEVDDLPDKCKLVLLDLDKDLRLSPHDVGVGISQVVPVVVAALARDAQLVAIEQPELHVHPRLQVAMGDLLIIGALGEANDPIEPRCLLIETHSEHLVLRLLRRIRETTESGGGPDVPPLKPDNVAVLYVKPGLRGSTIQRLRIDSEGEFIDKWPQGFFDERGEELFGK